MTTIAGVITNKPHPADASTAGRSQPEATEKPKMTQCEQTPKQCDQAMPPEVYASVMAVVDYLWKDERLDFFAEPDESHIFHHLV